MVGAQEAMDDGPAGRRSGPPAWHPDPNQHPATTKQWAEITRLRASSLCQQGLQACEQAVQLQRAAQELHAFLQQPREGRDAYQFIWVGTAILVPSKAPRQR